MTGNPKPLTTPNAPVHPLLEEPNDACPDVNPASELSIAQLVGLAFGLADDSDTHRGFLDSIANELELVGVALATGGDEGEWVPGVVRRHLDAMTYRVRYANELIRRCDDARRKAGLR